MSLSPRKKTANKQLAEGIAAAADDRYRYALYISKRLMNDYMHLCKERGTTSTIELTKFIEKEMKKYGEKS